MGTSDNTNINQIPLVICCEETLGSKSKGKQVLHVTTKFRNGLLLFVLISFLGYGILILLFAKNSIDVNHLETANNQSIGIIQQLKITSDQSINRILGLETTNNQSVEIIQRLRYRVKQLEQKAPQLRSSSMDIHPNATWIENALTVAGGNGRGNGNNQLDQPLGLYVDDNKTIYVTDRNNHRIVAWKYGATSGQVVVGGNGTHQLWYPYDVIFDRETNSVITSDGYHGRVVRWFRQHETSEQTIFSDIDSRGVTMDEDGSVYASNVKKNEVRRYLTGDTKEIVVAGGNGRGDRLDQLNDPYFVFVDRNHSVYVSDAGNHRVMKWDKDAKRGNVVAGGQGQGNELTQLHNPKGIAVDQLGTVYMADEGNHRIMRWPKGATRGSVIAGGNGVGEHSNQFKNPCGLSFDRHGNLYVADQGNHRVQKFNIEQTID